MDGHCVCHSDKVMREADANDTSGELGRNSKGSAFRTAKLEMLNPPVGYLSYRLFRSARVNCGYISSHWLYDKPQRFEDQNILNVPSPFSLNFCKHH